MTAWSPLRHFLFRAMWIAAVASNVGTWMHTVGASWLLAGLAAGWRMSLSARLSARRSNRGRIGYVE
jgi:hypothetical protein